jgi:hypothetical protein
LTIRRRVEQSYDQKCFASLDPCIDHQSGSFSLSRGLVTERVPQRSSRPNEVASALKRRITCPFGLESDGATAVQADTENSQLRSLHKCAIADHICVRMKALSFK